MSVSNLQSSLKRTTKRRGTFLFPSTWIKVIFWVLWQNSRRLMRWRHGIWVFPWCRLSHTSIATILRIGRSIVSFCYLLWGNNSTLFYSFHKPFFSFFSFAFENRDIKPENCLLSVSPNGLLVLKLADFGFAKEESSPNVFTTLCGTPSYVAPEILKRHSYGVLADTWSIGVVAYGLIGGYLPFRGDNEREVQQCIIDGMYHFDKQFWNHVSADAKDFIDSLLVVDPSERATAEVCWICYFCIYLVLHSPNISFCFDQLIWILSHSLRIICTIFCL